MNPSGLLADRAKGCLIGLAVGDALGAAVEFQNPGEFRPLTGFRAGGHGMLRIGQWTDDTAMALCLADSLLARGHLDPADLMTRFNRWRQEGYNSCTGTCFDIGVTVSEALDRFQQTGNPFAGDPSPMKAGNGSIMRLAPAVLANHDDLHHAMNTASAQGQTTHAAREAVDATRLLAGMMWHGLQGESQDSITTTLGTHAGQWITGEETSRIHRIAAGLEPWNDPPPTGGGYVVDSLKSALWAFQTTHNFEEGMLKAVNLGNDADTTGAVYGQLAGAIYGYRAIPRRWRLEVAWGKSIVDRAMDLVSKAPLRSRTRAPLELADRFSQSPGSTDRSCTH